MQFKKETEEIVKINLKPEEIKEHGYNDLQ